MMTELSFPSILTSGIILVVCGYAISIKSSIPAIGQVGHLVGRGAIFSVIFVTCLMPALFKLTDRLITGTFKSRHDRRMKMLKDFREYLRKVRSARNEESNKYREVEE